MAAGRDTADLQYGGESESRGLRMDGWMDGRMKGWIAPTSFCFVMFSFVSLLHTHTYTYMIDIYVYIVVLYRLYRRATSRVSAHRSLSPDWIRIDIPHQSTTTGRDLLCRGNVRTIISQ